MPDELKNDVKTDVKTREAWTTSGAKVIRDMLQDFYMWCDDKTQVIAVLGVFGVLNFYWSPASEQIMGNIVSGLLGVALGRALERGTPTNGNGTLKPS